MIEAQNERRRRDGRPLIDEDAYRGMVEMEEREEAQRRARMRAEAEAARAALGDKEFRRRQRAEEDKHRRWADKERRGF
jgi:hypothetical protein